MLALYNVCGYDFILCYYILISFSRTSDSWFIWLLSLNVVSLIKKLLLHIRRDRRHFYSISSIFWPLLHPNYNSVIPKLSLFLWYYSVLLCSRYSFILTPISLHRVLSHSVLRYSFLSLLLLLTLNSSY